MKIPLQYFSIGLLAAFSSCGIMGITKDNDPAITDPARRYEMLTGMENTPLAKYQDSLIARIDAATVVIPADLAEGTIILETLDYPNFVKAVKFKYDSRDSVKLKQEFLTNRRPKRLEKALTKLGYKTVYANEQTYKTFDPLVFRYVLKQTIRVEAERRDLQVTQSGFVYPLVASVIYYLYDRQTGNVFREIKDVKALEK